LIDHRNPQPLTIVVTVTSYNATFVTTKDGVADVVAALSAAFVTAKLEPRLAAKVLTADE